MAQQCSATPRPADFTWCCDPAAETVLRKQFPTDVEFEAFKNRLAQHVCVYYETTNGLKKALNVSPIACKVTGGKGFKVRWQVKGGGKSGGFRLAVLAICEKRWVNIAFADRRADDPADAQLVKAMKRAASPG